MYGAPISFQSNKNDDEILKRKIQQQNEERRRKQQIDPSIITPFPEQGPG